MKKEHLSIRIPIEILCHVEAQSELSSLTKSEVINKILEKYFLQKDISFGFHGFDSRFEPNREDNKEHEMSFQENLTPFEKQALNMFNLNKEPIFMLSTLVSPGNIEWINDSGKAFFEDTDYSLEDLISHFTLKPLFLNKLSSSEYLLKECELLSKDGFPFNVNIASFPLLGKKNIKVCVIDTSYDKMKDSYAKKKLSFVNLLGKFPLACLLFQQKKCVWGNVEIESLLGYSSYELKKKNMQDFFIDEKQAESFSDMLFRNKGFDLAEMTTVWINKYGKNMNIRLIAFPIKEFGEDFAVLFVRPQKENPCSKEHKVAV